SRREETTGNSDRSRDHRRDGRSAAAAPLVGGAYWQEPGGLVSTAGRGRLPRRGRTEGCPLRAVLPRQGSGWLTEAKAWSSPESAEPGKGNWSDFLNAGVNRIRTETYKDRSIHRPAKHRMGARWTLTSVAGASLHRGRADR